MKVLIFRLPRNMPIQAEGMLKYSSIHTQPWYQKQYTPAALSPWKTKYPRAGGLVGLGAGLDKAGKSFLHQHSIPGLSRP